MHSSSTRSLAAWDDRVHDVESNWNQCRVVIRGTNAVKTNAIVGATLHHATNGVVSGYGTNWTVIVPAESRSSGAKVVTVTETNITVY